MKEVLPKKAEGTSEAPFNADCPKFLVFLNHVVRNRRQYRGRGVSGVVMLHVSV